MNEFRYDADWKFLPAYPDTVATIKKAFTFKSAAEVVPILHEGGATVVVSAEYFRDKSTL